MTARATEVISLALKQKGIGEYPPGSNANKFSAWYWGEGTHGGQYSWCAVFVMWNMEQLDSRPLVPWSASCSAMVRGWKQRGADDDAANGAWLGKTSEPAVGDVFYVAGGPTGWEHVGLVATVHDDGQFTSIEGNWANGVKQVARKISGYSFARPYYNQEPPAATPANEPYVRFPGTRWFQSYPTHPIVEAMGRRLVQVGCSAYAEGPGPSWGSADRRSYAKFQLGRMGYQGSDADGWPGERSWKALKVPNPAYVKPGQTPDPKPTPDPTTPPPRRPDADPPKVPIMPGVPARLVKAPGNAAVYVVDLLGRAWHIEAAPNLAAGRKGDYYANGGAVEEITADELDKIRVKA